MNETKWKWNEICMQYYCDTHEIQHQTCQQPEKQIHGYYYIKIRFPVLIKKPLFYTTCAFNLAHTWPS